MNETTEQRTNGNAFQGSDEILRSWSMPTSDRSGEHLLTTDEQHSEHPTDQVSTQGTAQVSTHRSGRMSTIRLIPPVAALGAAFCLQVIAVTDMLGGSLSNQLGGWGYLLGALFGLAVASTFEGGAALLMDLYDKHMIAGDSTWSLKLSMLIYVSASAAALHWWAASRGITGVLPWMLAAMSAAALYLWSRGSRWDHREHMRATGQIDRALPRLSMGAKCLHPLRFITTLYLITWDQVSTTQEARDRYSSWKQRRKQRTPDQPIRAQVLTSDPITEQEAVSSEQVEQSPRAAITAQPEHTASTEQVIADDEPEGEQEAVITEQVEQRTQTRTISVTEQITEQVSTATGKASIEQLAETLAEHFADRIPGRPKALEVLRSEHGSCSEPRAKAAIRQLVEMRAQEAITDHQEAE